MGTAAEDKTRGNGGGSGSGSEEKSLAYATPGGFYFEGEAARQVFIAMLDAMKHPYASGMWTFTVEINAQGDIGFWQPFTFDPDVEADGNSMKGVGVGARWVRVKDFQGGDKPGAKGGGPGDGENWLSNAGTALGMTMMWATGYRLPFGAGSYYSNDAVANAMRNAYGVGKARDYFYNKFKGEKKLDGASVTEYRAGFGLIGLMRAGIDPIEQFIGNYRIDIRVQGNMLQYTLTNNTSFKSFLYGVGPSWEGGPMGNFYQTYIFTEPINFKRLK